MFYKKSGAAAHPWAATGLEWPTAPTIARTHLVRGITDRAILEDGPGLYSDKSGTLAAKKFRRRTERGLEILSGPNIM
jgi:hypothetical protein